MAYSIAAGADGSTLTLWRGGPMEPRPVAVTSQFDLRDDPDVWDLLVATYGGPQQVTTDELETLAFDSGQAITFGPITAWVAVDGVTYEAPLSEVSA